MTRFLANWDVEADVILPEKIPFLRYDHPAGTYTVFVRNIPGEMGDVAYFSMQIAFDAASLQEAKPVAEAHSKEFLDYLCFVTNLKVPSRSW